MWARRKRDIVAPVTVSVKIKEGVDRPFRIFYLIQTTAAESDSLKPVLIVTQCRY